jgi:phage-related holin
MILKLLVFFEVTSFIASFFFTHISHLICVYIDAMVINFLLPTFKQAEGDSR